MKKEQKLEQQPNSDSIADNLQVSPACPKPIVSGWVSVDDRLPETLETVWVSDGKGWTTLCKLPQKQYVLKVAKLVNFKNVKHEKESIHPHPDCQHTQGV